MLSLPGVTAVDIGYKISNGQFTDKLALRVHVERKLPPEVFKEEDRSRELIDNEVLPKYFLPNDPDGKYDSNDEYVPGGERVPMDVIEADYKLVAELPRPRVLLENPGRGSGQPTAAR